MKRYLSYIFFFLFAFALTSCDQIKKQRTMKLAHSLDVNHSVHKAMIKMGEDLAKLSVINYKFKNTIISSHLFFSVEFVATELI